MLNLFRGKLPECGWLDFVWKLRFRQLLRHIESYCSEWFLRSRLIFACCLNKLRQLHPQQLLCLSRIELLHELWHWAVLLGWVDRLRSIVFFGAICSFVQLHRMPCWHIVEYNRCNIVIHMHDLCRGELCFSGF